MSSDGGQDPSHLQKGSTMGSHFNRNALPSKDKAPRVWIVVMASIIIAILCVVGVKLVSPLLGLPIIIALLVLYVKCAPSTSTD